MFKMETSVGKYKALFFNGIFLGIFLEPNYMRHENSISVLTEDNLFYVFSLEGKLIKGIKSFLNIYIRIGHYMYTIIKNKKIIIKNFQGDTILMMTSKYGWRTPIIENGKVTIIRDNGTSISGIS